jgi:hypothetical protein
MAWAKFNPQALCLLAAGVLTGASVLADTYKWVDENGKVHYTDRLPAEAVNRGMTELNKQGIPKKVTEPAPTPEQRRAADERLEQQRQAEKVRAEQRRQENALLSSYTSENDIDVARERDLALIGSSILGAEARIKALRRRLAELEQEKLFYETKPVPDRLMWELTSIEGEFPVLYAQIAQKNEEALAVINRYEQQKLRFRELKARVAIEAAVVRKQ